MRNIRAIIDTIATSLIAVVAVAMGWVFFRDRRAIAEPAHGEVLVPRLIANWKDDNRDGIFLIGDQNTPVVLTEFVDFECPYCARIVPRLDTLMKQFEGKIALVIQHYPLSMHKFAMPAAIAAECADRQGKFAEMYRVLFAGRDSFGLKPWRGFAESAGVSRLGAFEKCVKMPGDSFPRIAAGIALATREGVRGTPTVWVNGMAIGRTDLGGLTIYSKQALAGSR